MEKPEAHEIAISGSDVDLTPVMESFIRRRTDCLFSHERGVSCVSVDLSRARPGGTGFVAKGQVRTPERLVFASVSAEEWRQSVSFLIDHLDKIVAR